MKAAFKINTGTLMVIAAVITVIVLATVFFADQMLANERAKTMAQLEDVAKAETMTIRSTVEQKTDMIVTLSRIAAQRIDPLSDENLRILTRTISTVDAVTLCLADPDGLCRSAISYIGDISDREYFQRAMKGETVVSELLTNEAYGESIIVVATPITTGFGVAGVLTGVFEAEQLTSVLDLSSFDGQGYTHIVQGDGIFIYRAEHANAISDELSDLVSIWDLPNELLKDGANLPTLKNCIEAGESGFFRFELPGFGDQWAYYTPVGVNDWYLITVVPAAVIDQKADLDKRAALVLVVAIIVSMIALLAVLLYNRIDATRRLHKSNEALSLTMRRFEIAVAHSAGAIFEYDPKLDTLKRYTHRMSNFPELIEHPLEVFSQAGVLHPGSRSDLETALQAGNDGAEQYSCSLLLRLDADDDFSYYRLTVTNTFDENGRYTMAIGSLENIDDLRENEIELARQTQLKSAMLEDALLSFDVNLSRNTVTISSEDQQQLFGFIGEQTYDQMIDFAGRERVWSEDVEKFDYLLNRQRLLNSFPLGETEVSFEYKRLLENEYRWLHLTMKMILDKPSGEILGVFYVNDIHGDKIHELELIHQADHDPLTGILNRAASERVIMQYLRDNPSHTCAFLLLDVDAFKQINDCFGHMTGDKVLIGLAHTLQQVLRSSDIIGRLAGDEFLALLKDINPADAMSKAVELAAAFSQWHDEAAPSCLASCSIGIAPGKAGVDFAALYHQADLALYEAKRQGRNCCVFYDPSLEGLDNGKNGEDTP